MLTRCPACSTTFRVAAEQLRARAGRVRCGTCRHAFNALDTLVDESAGSAIPPAGTGQIEPVETIETSGSPAESIGPTDLVEPADKSAVAPAPTFDDAASEPPLAAMPEDVNAEVPAVREHRLLDTPFPELLPGPAAPRRWLWLAGSLLLLVALGIQAVIAFRVELAVLAPAARPALVSLCNIAGCTVSLPARAELIGIESSDLHPDLAQPGRLIVSATLKNRAPFSQQFPHLELTLTDIADKAVVRKVLTAADYLPPQTPSAGGMRPNADIAVSFVVDIGQLPANGYRLYLFYP